MHAARMCSISSTPHSKDGTTAVMTRVSQHAPPMPSFSMCSQATGSLWQLRLHPPVSHPQYVCHDAVAGTAAHKRLKHLSLQTKRTCSSSSSTKRAVFDMLQQPCHCHAVQGCPVVHIALHMATSPSRASAWHLSLHRRCRPPLA
jgi:hypothetical protein